MNNIKSTITLVLSTMAATIAPPPMVTPSAWASNDLIVSDGPRAGEKWSADLTPQLVEILDCLDPEHPANRVSVKKSAQTGMTGAGVAWLGSIIAVNPATSLVVFPTINAVQDFNREKLQPTIDQTPALRRSVFKQISRSTRGSTSLNKRFGGGSLILTGANSAADLRSKTVKNLFCDEIDEWPKDLDGQGDPMEMADARQMAFHRSGGYKKFECSTPTIKGASAIDDAFEAGDQRYWQCPCPHCGFEQRLEFKNLKFNKIWPHEARYACFECGVLIAPNEQSAMVRAGRWVATNPGPGRHPSFHLDSLTSLLTTWDKVAEKFINADGDPQKLKAFVNLWLGETWEERGEAPEWKRLYARRSSYTSGQIPPGGLVLFTACDVQKTGIYYETVAYGPGKRTWSIDADFIEGDPADEKNQVWAILDDLFSKHYQDAYGNTRPVDLFGVDTGYLSNQVYNWIRPRQPRAVAIDGRDGWNTPAIIAPKKRGRGHKKTLADKLGVEIFGVGTYSLKGELYSNLRKDGIRDGAEMDPPGFCHFSSQHSKEYFQQLTSEYIKETPTKKGKILKTWVARGHNHWHDCRIYNMGLAAKWGLDFFDDAAWEKLARDRGLDFDDIDGGLARLWLGQPVLTDDHPVIEPEKSKTRTADSNTPETALERLARLNNT